MTHLLPPLPHAVTHVGLEAKTEGDHWVADAGNHEVIHMRRREVRKELAECVRGRSGKGEEQTSAPRTACRGPGGMEGSSRQYGACTPAPTTGEEH
jgi:hypothetical protein